jgi:5-methylthioadenosine/S-adenosylhomocysteine deaminase
LVYAVNSGSVDTVLVDGRPLMRHKEILVLDEKALLAEARVACGQLFARAGLVG